jgi:hypothetical protein
MNDITVTNNNNGQIMLMRSQGVWQINADDLCSQLAAHDYSIMAFDRYAEWEEAKLMLEQHQCTEFVDMVTKIIARAEARQAQDKPLPPVETFSVKDL